MNGKQIMQEQYGASSAYELGNLSELNHLMNFEYTEKKKSALPLRLAAIAFLIGMIYLMLPLLPVSCEAYTAHGASSAGTTITISNEVLTSGNSATAA